MEIKHIGAVYTLCGGPSYWPKVNDHLGIERYKDKAHYRICKKCLIVVMRRGKGEGNDSET